MSVVAGITYEEACWKCGDESKLTCMLRDGSAQEFKHKGIRMVSFPRVKIGKLDVVTDKQEVSKAKQVADGTFDKLSETDLFKILCWAPLPAMEDGAEVTALHCSLCQHDISQFSFN